MARKAGERRKRPQAAAPGKRSGVAAALAAFQQGRPDETAAICARILAAKPREPSALHLLGIAYLALGQADDAAETLGRASAADPNNADVHANLGAALRAGGQVAAAEAALRKAIALAPGHLQARFNLGNCLADGGRAAEAVACYREVVAAEPRHAGAHNNMGLALESLGDADGAMACFEAAIAADAGHRDAHRNIARLQRAAGLLAESLVHLEAVIAAQPNDIASRNDRGVVLFELERIEEAAAALSGVLSLAPDCLDAHVNLGNVLCATDRADEAIAHFESALALDPGSVDVVVNMGHARKHKGDIPAAIATYDRAIAMQPDNDEAWFGKGVCHLLQGAFADGWRGYRHRESMRTADAGYWRGPLPDDLSGQRVLVVRDQGIGDEVFFLRFLPALASRGAETAYLPDRRLAAMLARAALADVVLEAEAPPEGFDYRLSVGDLALVLEAGAGDVPPTIRLSPEPGREDRLRERLAAFGPPPWIGVTWRAGTRGRQSLLYKESPAARIAAALSGRDVRVIALQRNPRAGELAAFADALGREVCDLTALNDDLEDMLALVGLLDEQVCVSNTNVHLAASRGRACRVLVPNPPEFRWMAAGEQSPWFPDCAVYRQDSTGDWSAAFAALGRDLAAAYPATQGD